MARNQYGMGSIQVRKNRKGQPTSYFCRYKGDRSPAYPYNRAGLEAAHDWLRERTSEVQAQTYVPVSQRATFAETLSDWRANQLQRTKLTGRHRITQRQFNHQESCLRLFYEKYEVKLGQGSIRLYDMKAADLTVGQAKGMVLDLRAEKNTEATAANYWSVFQNWMAFIVENGATYGVKINPLDAFQTSFDRTFYSVNGEDAQLPRKADVSPERISAILNLAENTYFKTLLWCMALCGPRRGEAAALWWQDIEAEWNPVCEYNGLDRMHIRKTINSDYKYSFEKTKKGHRANENGIPFGPALSNLLREWYMASGRPNDPEALVFPSLSDKAKFDKQGIPWRYELYKCVFRHAGFDLRLVQRMRDGKQKFYHVYKNGQMLDSYRTIEQACHYHKVKHLRLHDLRHFYASKLIAEGLDTRDITRLMGHESITTTEKIYDEWLPRPSYEFVGAATERGMQISA